MLALYILTTLLSCSTLRVLSAPLPIGEGDLATYRQPNADGKRFRPHPVVVVSDEKKESGVAQHDVVAVSHNLPVEEHPHQNPSARYGIPGDGAVSMIPESVPAAKLKPGDDKIQPNIGQDKLLLLKDDINACKTGQCNHAQPAQPQPAQPLQPAKPVAQPVKAQPQQPLKPAALVAKPAVQLAKPQAQPAKPAWDGKKIIDAHKPK